MKRTAGFLVTLALLAVAFVTSTKAETVQAGLALSPANEVPPIAGLNASAAFQITVTVVRDANGAITSGSVRFSGSVAFPGTVTFTGLHIHEGIATSTGPVVIGTDINNSTNSITFTSGAGLIDKTVENVNVAVLGRLLKNPAGFYVNLHTTANGSGAVRGQLI
ncbi:MAG TPA: CHRD domain-containing protein, partial [Blastocatellia bacterium]